METMLVAAQSESGKAYFVLKNSLKDLIENRKIQKFRRSDGWVHIDEDQRTGHKTEYNGPERRVGNVVDWTLFPLSIGEQLRRGHSVEAILGCGGKARAAAG